MTKKFPKNIRSNVFGIIIIVKMMKIYCGIRKRNVKLPAMMPMAEKTPLATKADQAPSTNIPV
jgi:hypothetical protein